MYPMKQKIYCYVFRSESEDGPKSAYLELAAQFENLNLTPPPEVVFRRFREALGEWLLSLSEEERPESLNIQGFVEGAVHYDSTFQDACRSRKISVMAVENLKAASAMSYDDNLLPLADTKNE